MLRAQPNVWLVASLAFAVIALNIVDALSTLHWIQLGAQEANPFMAYVLEYDTVAFWLFKTLGITFAVAFLIGCTVKRYTIALYGLALLTLVYLIPLAVHVFIYTHTSLV